MGLYTEETPKVPPSYRHVWRLVIVLAIGVAGALVFLGAMRPPTFGLKGHYRAAAEVEARQLPVRHFSQKNCVSCHKREVEARPRDTHVGVECVACHGIARQHIEWHEKHKGTTAKAPVSARMPRRAENSWCKTCHQRLTARPATHPQIDDRHFELVGAKKVDAKGKPLRCVVCHEPHSPLSLNDKRKAKPHPVVARCRDCHARMSTVRATAVALEARQLHSPHKSLFNCQHCHAEKVTQAAQGAHKKLECTRCHMFFKDTVAISGRVLRDGGPGFCLLCHKQGHFTGKGAPPSIDWPEGHLDDVGDGEADAKKVCVDCHMSAIHAKEAE